MYKDWVKINLMTSDWLLLDSQKLSSSFLAHCRDLNRSLVGEFVQHKLCYFLTTMLLE